MELPPKKISIGILLFFASVLIVCGVYIRNSKAKIPDMEQSVDSFNSFWKKEISTKGGYIAYKEFKESNFHKKPEMQHLAAHFIGSDLYDVLGYKAITICDLSYRYGCYHGVFSSAIKEGGLSVVSKLDEKCFGGKILPTPCQHGIGHGLMEYFGEGKGAAEKSLNECSKLRFNKNYAGCSYGVFMEYELNLAESFQSVNLISKKYSSFQICDGFAKKRDRESCFFTMPKWWRLFYGDSYSKIGKMCGEISDDKACFMGLGRDILSQQNYNVRNTIVLCKKISNSNNLVNCLSGAYLAYLNLIPNKKNFAIQLCDGLSVTGKNECLRQ
ncbi:MAG TPA: hypothetical protein VG917_00245 [Patescibacteria group bacterium]|nr:hypothetical protein [Patescibacteria group bacterium]